MNPLPGYLPKRSPEFKRKVNLKKEACVTVEEFELMLVKLALIRTKASG